jgi:hypothetical protein
MYPPYSMKDIVKMDLRETGWSGMDCIYLAHYYYYYYYSVMNPWNQTNCKRARNILL